MLWRQSKCCQHLLETYHTIYRLVIYFYIRKLAFQQFIKILQQQKLMMKWYELICKLDVNLLYGARYNPHKLFCYCWVHSLFIFPCPFLYYEGFVRSCLFYVYPQYTHWCENRWKTYCDWYFERKKKSIDDCWHSIFQSIMSQIQSLTEIICFCHYFQIKVCLDQKWQHFFFRS